MIALAPACYGAAMLLVIYLTIMALLVQYKQDMSIANFTWGGGCALLGLYTLFFSASFLSRQLLLSTLTLIWAGRMVVHLYMRYTGHDPRFISWRTYKGIQAFLMHLIYIFGPQVLLLVTMSLPVVCVNLSIQQSNLNLLDVVGLCLWLFGFCFEAVSDYQLFVFMHNPENKGKIMRYGLWRHSRHPNYFGEICLWWGMYLITLSVPMGWIVIVSPLTITILLLFVTGIPWVEKALANNPEFQAYKRQTSAFIPWFVKETA